MNDNLRSCYVPGSMSQLRQYLPLVLVIAGLVLLAACSQLPLANSAQSSTSMVAIPTTSVLGNPTMADLWNGTASFVLDLPETGLPMGESDTVQLTATYLRSYVHASYQSAGVVDSCGVPVEFPGCVVTYSSMDSGKSFQIDGHPPQCRLPCRACPCVSRRDHVDQQQYPRIARYLSKHDGSPQWLMVYEYRANIFISRSRDGLSWNTPSEVPLTGIWRTWLMPCRPEELVGDHPFATREYDCLVGGPPGIFIDTTGVDAELYVFVGLGQNPGSIGCLRGPADGPTTLLTKCQHNPLFTGHSEYGPLEDSGPAANRHFGFRTVSSVKLVPTGDRFYMFFEGVRGPDRGAAGDTQFALGLARSMTDKIDGVWELFPGNPIIVDLPGNVGVGHADLVTNEGVTYLYTSLDGVRRSRLRLNWLE